MYTIYYIFQFQNPNVLCISQNSALIFFLECVWPLTSSGVFLFADRGTFRFSLLLTETPEHLNDSAVALLITSLTVTQMALRETHKSFWAGNVGRVGVKCTFKRLKAGDETSKAEPQHKASVLLSFANILFHNMGLSYLYLGAIFFFFLLLLLLNNISFCCCWKIPFF